PAGGPHRRRRRCLRCADVGTLVSARAGPRRSVRDAAARSGVYARRDGRGRIARRHRAGRPLIVYSIARPCAPLPRALLSDAPLPLLVTLGVLTAGAGILAATEIVPRAPRSARCSVCICW